MCYLPFKIRMLNPFNSASNPFNGASNPFNGILTAIKKYMNLEPEPEFDIELREIVIIDTQPTTSPYEKPQECLKPTEIDDTIKFYDNIYAEFDMIESIDS